ncbi:uncharacterized protein LOC125291876 [Alosa alosa]|nr:uncharacterized protein LOC125291876 [Alosa alosa]
MAENESPIQGPLLEGSSCNEVGGGSHCPAGRTNQLDLSENYTVLNSCGLAENAPENPSTLVSDRPLRDSQENSNHTSILTSRQSSCFSVCLWFHHLASIILEFLRKALSCKDETEMREQSSHDISFSNSLLTAITSLTPDYQPVSGDDSLPLQEQDKDSNSEHHSHSLSLEHVSDPDTRTAENTSSSAGGAPKRSLCLETKSDICECRTTSLTTMFQSKDEDLCYDNNSEHTCSLTSESCGEAYDSDAEMAGSESSSPSPEKRLCSETTSEACDSINSLLHHSVDENTIYIRGNINDLMSQKTCFCQKERTSSLCERTFPGDRKRTTSPGQGSRHQTVQSRKVAKKSSTAQGQSRRDSTDEESVSPPKQRRNM